MSDFWKAIREFRMEKKRKGEWIAKGAWLKHFKKLLGGKDKGEEGSIKGSKKGIEKLGRKVMLEEVQRALGKMKNGKAQGEMG